jgi:hypothetical protein
VYLKLKKELLEEVLPKLKEIITNSSNLQKKHDLVIRDKVKRDDYYQLETEDERQIYETNLKQKQEKKKSDFEKVKLNEEIIDERNKDIFKIENEVNSLVDIMEDLSIFTKSLEQPLVLIEDNIDQTKVHIVEAQKELKKADKYDKGGLYLICAILIVIGCALLGAAVALIIFLKVFLKV